MGKNKGQDFLDNIKGALEKAELNVPIADITKDMIKDAMKVVTTEHEVEHKALSMKDRMGIGSGAVKKIEQEKKIVPGGEFKINTGGRVQE